MLILLKFTTFAFVMSKKIFISMILLLTYSLGFAHNIVPHHHHAETEHHEINHEQAGHHHHHHKSSKDLNTDHKHISHGDHFDESLYDLLVCFLHEAQQEDECKNQHYIPVETNRVVINTFQINNLVTILFSINLETDMYETFSRHQINSETAYLSPLIEDTPLRGPPSIS